MTFSSSMSVIEFYFLKRFPIPYGNFLIYFFSFFYKDVTQPIIHAGFSKMIVFPFLLAALYLFAVAALAALVGQHLVGKVINVLGRASLIIFILALIIFLSVTLLGLYDLKSAFLVFIIIFQSSCLN